MKLQSYEPQVRMSQPRGATVVVSNDPNAYAEGNGVDMRELSRAVGKWSVELDRQIENEDRVAVLKAMDVYNQGRYDIMYNEKDGLMNAKGEAANGITQTYTDRTNALRSQVLDTFKVQKKTNLAGLVNLMDRSGQQGLVAVNRHQYQQGEAVKDAALNNNVSSIANMLQKNYSVPNAISDALANAHLMVSARYGDAGKDVVDAANKKADAEVLGATISGAIAQDDYKSANAILTQYGDMLTPQQKVQFTNRIQTQGSQEHLIKLGTAAAQMFGDNEAAAVEWLRNQAGFSVTGDNRAMTEVEIRSARNVYLGEMHTQKRLQRDFLNNSTENFSRELLKEYDKGMTFDVAMEYAKDKAGDNDDLYKIYSQRVRDFYFGDGKRLSDQQRKWAFAQLQSGKYSSVEDYVHDMKKTLNADPFDQAELSTDFIDWRYGRKGFKYKGKDLVDMVFPNNKLNKSLTDYQKTALYNGVQYYVNQQYAAWKIANKGNGEPDMNTVIDWAQQSLTFAPVYEGNTQPKYVPRYDERLGYSVMRRETTTDSRWDDFETSPAAILSSGILYADVNNAKGDEITIIDEGSNKQRKISADEFKRKVSANADLFKSKSYKK